MVNRFRFVLAIICLIGSAHAAEKTAPDPSMITMTLVPDKTLVMVGEPVYFNFVIENISAKEIEIQITVDHDYELRAFDSASGKLMHGVRRTWLCMVFPETIKLKPKEKHTIPALLQNWVFLREPGNYLIKIELLPSYGENGAKIGLSGSAETTLEIVPLDQGKLGVIIDRLGNAMMAAKNGDLWAANALSVVEDERAIGWFIKALSIKNYDTQNSALKALARFNNDAAYQALKGALDIRTEDTGGNNPDWSAGSLRSTAAYGLAISPYKKAQPFLLSQRNSVHTEVRSQYVQLLNRSNSDEATATIREMLNDPDIKIVEMVGRILKDREKASNR